MQYHSFAFEAVTTLSNDLSNGIVKRICKRHMTNKTTFEESEWSNALGSIDHLVWNHEVSRLDFRL